MRSLTLADLLSMDRTAVVQVSRTGRAGAELMQVLRSAVISASAIEGGMRAWLAAGLPLETDALRALSPRL